LEREKNKRSWCHQLFQERGKEERSLSFPAGSLGYLLVFSTTGPFGMNPGSLSLPFHCSICSLDGFLSPPTGETKNFSFTYSDQLCERERDEREI
jgi:hypothetical protein